MGCSDAISPRPYRLHNRIMDYAWGTKDVCAFIPRLLGIPAEPGKPYAELWMGAHPKAPSEIDLGGRRVPLDEAIAKAPQAILGPRVAARFGAKLPFLLKVLSAGQPLSIQAHPNKAQAAALHARDPEHYPDDNHKPEIAVALEYLEVMVGFRPAHQIDYELDRHPELAELAGLPAVRVVREAVGADPLAQARAVYQAFTSLLADATARPDGMAASLDRLETRLRRKGHYIPSEARFLDLRERYSGADVGHLAPFFLCTTVLGEGDGLYTPAGVPHAYLRGNLVECMANSDNVVRVGLTPKFRDVQALAEILDATTGWPKTIDAQREVGRQVYPTPAAEFQVSRVRLEKGGIQACETSGPEILIVIWGSVSLRWEGQVERCDRGQSALIPACLPRYTVRAETDAEWFTASVPPD